VALLGEYGVGKNKIISQIKPKYAPKSGCQLVYKIFEYPDIGKSIKFDIWDTAGKEEYRALSKIFYKNAKVVILVYDITKKKSFEEIKNYWYQSVKNDCENMPILAVVANKIHKSEYQEVKDNEGKSFADEIGAIFQTSSKLSND
jgi:small GTP-binding protein